MTTQQFELAAKLHNLDGASNFHLELYGNDLAKKNGYKEHQGIDAIQFYLMQKHNWLPSAVRSMSLDDLKFAIAEDKNGWTIPAEARGAYPVGEVTISDVNINIRE